MFRLLVLLLLVAGRLSSQTELPVSRTIQKTYEKGTRSTTGAPGKNYWQNTAEYDINVRFDPATNQLTGSLDINYVNNSPDSLTNLVLKLYPNLYKKGVARMTNLAADDLTDGVHIQRLLLNGSEIPARLQQVNGTNLFLRTRPIPPGATTRLVIDYSYNLNKTSHLRTGQVDEGAWFVAYFFPRVAVYDDIDGWNLNPYLGTQEFYNDFCRFQLAVTVPAGYLVWATGDLQNCKEVLAGKYCERLAAAERNDALRFIIDTADLKAGNLTAPNVENTFRFIANQVPDMAFAVSNHYLWESGSLVVDSTTGRRTRVDAVFHPDHQDYYLVAGDAWKTVQAMSFQFPKWPFPYSHMTVFDGLDQMEYPMMANDNPVEDRAESIELTDHEIFHTMFPFYMGTNETKYGWMDEGWATIGEWLISPMIDPSIVDAYGMAGYEDAAGTEIDLPIMTLTTQLAGRSMFINSYPKPALGYLYVKDWLGDELFFKGLHHYIRQWNGKHPMPYDFFYSMNSGTGVDMNWFWKAWFFDSGVPDLAITQVKERGRKKSVLVASVGAKPVPIDLKVTFTDGTEQRLHRPVAVWAKGARQATIQFRSDKKIQSVELGSVYVPDVNKADNRFPR